MTVKQLMIAGLLGTGAIAAGLYLAPRQAPVTRPARTQLAENPRPAASAVRPSRKPARRAGQRRPWLGVSRKSTS